jgi:hypothetical protein
MQQFREAYASNADRQPARNLDVIFVQVLELDTEADYNNELTVSSLTDAPTPNRPRHRTCLPTHLNDYLVELPTS